MVDCLNFAVTDPPAAVGSATTFTDASRVLGAFREFSARSPIKVLELSVFFVVHPIRPNARRVMRLIRLIAVCCLLFAVCTDFISIVISPISLFQKSHSCSLLIRCICLWQILFYCQAYPSEFLRMVIPLLFFSLHL